MKIRFKSVKVKLNWWEVVIALVLIYGLLTTDFNAIIELLSYLKK